MVSITVAFVLVAGVTDLIFTTVKELVTIFVIAMVKPIIFVMVMLMLIIINLIIFMEAIKKM